MVALGALAACLLTPPAAGALPASFGSEGARAGQISEKAQGIAVEQQSGDVYVADRQNARIDKFGPEGEFLLAFGWGVADGETQALQACTTSCFKGLEGAGAGEFFSEGGPEGIAVDNDPFSASHGDIYVVDPRNKRVQKFGPQGEFLLMFGGEVNAGDNSDICVAGESCQAGVEGSEAGQFDGLTARSIAVGPEGSVYVGDANRVQRFSEGGAVEGEVTLGGAGQIVNLAVDASKDLYLHGGSQQGVHKYEPTEPTGVELGSPRDPAGEPNGLSLAIGPADEVFVNDFRLPSGPHHILTFEPEGEQSASFDRGGEAENGQRGIAYSAFTKALYVLNAGAVRIVPPPPPGPLVLEQSASEVEPTTARLGALVNPEGAASEYHFEYGTTASYGESTPTSAPLSAVNEVQSLTVTATGGDFKLTFNKGEVSKKSEEIKFDATAGEVQEALEEIPGLGAGQVAVSGEAGGPWSVEFTGARAGEDVPELSAGSSEGAEPLKGPEPSAVVATTTPGFSLFDDRAASGAITGLAPATTYHFRAVATNGSQTTTGPDQSFTTLPAISIDGTSAAQVNATSATLQAELNPHGLPSTYHFQYGLTSAYGKSVPVPDASAGSGTSDTTVSNLIEELLPSTTYHYRVIARNALNKAGEYVTGPDRSFTTQGPGSTLADGRTWELVSPPNKHGAPLQPLSGVGGVIQAAAGGGGLTYFAEGPIDSEPQGNRSLHNSQLLSARDPATGWSTQNITTPHEEVSQVIVGAASEYYLFSEELSAGVLEPEGATALAPTPSEPHPERTPYRREADGRFVPLVSAANVPAGTKFGGEEGPAGSGVWGGGVELDTATPDLGHVVLSSPQLLAPGFKPGFEANGARNLYELTGGQLTLVSVLPNKEATSEAGVGAAVGHGGVNMRGAIANDGSRVAFEGDDNHLYLRDTTLGQTLQLDVPQPGAAGGGGKAVFQAASGDGGRVFFTDASQLTADSTAKPGQPDLYMCEVKAPAGSLTCALSDLSVDAVPGEAARVAKDVSAIDAAGAHVYFAASGVLTSAPNAHGEVAAAGSCEVKAGTSSTCNLYEYDTAARRVALVAVLSSKDSPDWGTQLASAGGGSFGNLTARSSPDGRYFTFMSRRSLTGYDNRDAASGQPDEEVYLFDAESGDLSCVSCNPTGARPLGVFDEGRFGTSLGLLVDNPASWVGAWLAGSIPGWTLKNLDTALYQSRYLSDSGRTFFTSSDALVPQDTNKLMDVYEYEPAGVGDCTSSARTYSSASGGCVSLISSGSSQEESAFLDASASGDEVFFLTNARLLSSDLDTAFDVYDAHVCSASSPCPPPPAPPTPPCEGDSCQHPSPPPGEQTPGSLTYKGPENPPPPPPAKAKAPTHKQLLAKALSACKKKKQKRKRAACERQARKRYAPKQAGAKRAAKNAGHAAHRSAGR